MSQELTKYEWMNKMRWKIARNMLTLRLKDGYTLTELAGMMGVTINTISRWENGHHAMKAEELMYLCYLTGWKLKDLLK